MYSALASSRPSSAPSTPSATSASMRFAVAVTVMPRSIDSVRMPCTIGNVPAFLMSIRSVPTPTLAMIEVSMPTLAPANWSM